MFFIKKIQQFIKKEVVLCVALLLAVISSFLVLPDREYAGYIDYRTLGILFCLMCVMAGLQKQGVFRWVAEKLLAKVNRTSYVVLLLVMLCFFFSMGITNDVALITFVPFTFTIGKLLGRKTYAKMVFPVVVLQTIAANLGSMLTPVGNPQNLYLYGIAGLSMGEFVKVMLPYSLFSLLLLFLCCMIFGKSLDSKTKKTAMENAVAESPLGESPETGKQEGGKIAGYLVLFLVSLLTVAKIIPFPVTLMITVLGVLILDRSVLKKVDYGLLLTFVGFFIFIGNMGRIPLFAQTLRKLIESNEVWVAILASQCISNVPAALLLSGFTNRYTALLIGTNLGGLGTLIASMASLISYKYIATEAGREKLPGGKGRYFKLFTAANVVFLILLIILYLIID